jgi:NADPH:quinone reductase-like Zn-dependent oxidoreductase
MPGSVRAARLHRHGEPLVIEDVEPRELSGDEVRRAGVRGVNPVDACVAAERVNPDSPLPRTLGAEASGAIDGRCMLVAGEGLGVVRDGV